jgi:hypothetical protein
LNQAQPVGKILSLKGRLRKLVEEVEADTGHPVLATIDSGLDVAAEIGFEDDADAWILTLKSSDAPEALIGHELCHLFQFSDPSWKQTRITVARGAGTRYDFLRDWIQSLLWDPWADFEASHRGFDICGYAHPYFVQYIEGLRNFETGMERSMSPVDLVKLSIDYTYKALDGKLCGFSQEWKECEREFQRVAPRMSKLGSTIVDSMLAEEINTPRGVAQAFPKILEAIDNTLPGLDLRENLIMSSRLVTSMAVAAADRTSTSKSRKSKRAF